MQSSSTKPARLLRATRRWSPLLLGLNALWIAACLYDADERCRDGRVYEDGLCVCPKGTTEKGIQCVKDTKAPGGLGVECGDENPCTDDTFSVCHVEGDKPGYCTSEGCSEDAECGGDYYCAVAEPRFCRRMPTGVNAPCTTSDDCAEFDAKYCTSGSTGSFCVIAHCTDDSVCGPGTECQDLSQFRPGVPKICFMPLGL